VTASGWPEVFLVGAARAGTTALYHALRGHPELLVPAIKEPNYFALGGRPAAFPDPGAKRVNQRSVHVAADYLALYGGRNGRRRGVDCSPVYLYSPIAAAAIAAVQPRAKIICVLRHPVDRAFSSYLHMRKLGSEEATSFDQALRNEPANVARNYWFIAHYTAASRYAPQLTRYYDAFPAENILCLRYDDLRADPTTALATIQRFLGLRVPIEALTAAGINVSGRPRGPLATTILRQDALIRRAGRRLVPRRWRQPLIQGAQALLLRAERLDPRRRLELTALFRDDLRATGEISGLDLSEWASSA
jgi:hypothetical protein